MKKIIFILLFIPVIAGAQSSMDKFYGSSVTRAYGADTLVGYQAAETTGDGWAGMITKSGTDTTLFITDATGYGIIYNSNNNIRFNVTNVGIAGAGVSAYDASSILTASSTTKGVLIPRMTAAEKGAISTPATGLLIFQTDGTTGFYFWNGSAWLHVGSSGGIGGNLDDAYNYGGAGAGRSITADNGAVEITGNFVANLNDFYLQADTHNFFGVGDVPLVGGISDFGTGTYVNAIGDYSSIGGALTKSLYSGWLSTLGSNALIIDTAECNLTMGNNNLMYANNSLIAIALDPTLKIGLWGTTPVVQPTTSITAAAFVANTSGISDDSATFGGYTLGQIVAALQAIGILE